MHNKFDHNQLLQEPTYQQLSPDQQALTMTLTKIIRDADKIQNMTYDVFDNFHALERFDKSIHNGDNTFTQPIISDAVLSSLLE